MMILYTKLPPHMRTGAELYVEHGVLSGGFLRAVLENDLVKAFGAADGLNTYAMPDWASWLYNDAPSDSWGSPEKVKSWCEHNGLEGLRGE
jgi:hypothetical protein